MHDGLYFFYFFWMALSLDSGSFLLSMYWLVFKRTLWRLLGFSLCSIFSSAILFPVNSSYSQILSSISTQVAHQALLEFLPSVQWPGSSLKAICLGQWYGLPHLFLSSRDHCPSLTDCQYFENHCYIYFVCFVFVISTWRVNLVPSWLKVEAIPILF